MTGNLCMEKSISCVRVLVQYISIDCLIIIIHMIDGVIIDFIFKNIRKTCNINNC